MKQKLLLVIAVLVVYLGAAAMDFYQTIVAPLACIIVILVLFWPTKNN